MHCSFNILTASCVIVTLLAMQSATASTATKKVLQPDGDLIELDEDNWHLMLTGEWMIEFFAPWCPACKNLAPVWERYASTAKDVYVHVAKIDVTTSPSLSGRFFVTALPTIYHVKDGEFRQYRGARDAEALLYFLKKKSWQSIEPLSSWKKPDTIHMSLLSYFFKLSHTLKDFNARLQAEYGVPTWGSYALFAMATIFVGAAMGLILVCIVDFVYPPKKSQRQSFSESQEHLAEGVEDLATEDIVDDEDNKENVEDEEHNSDEAEEEEEDDAEVEAEAESEQIEQDDGEKTQKKQAETKAEKVETTNNTAGDETTEVTDKPSTEQVRKRKPRKAD